LGEVINEVAYSGEDIQIAMERHDNGQTAKFSNVAAAILPAGEGGILPLGWGR